MSFVISSDSCLDELKENLTKKQIYTIPMTVIKEEGTFKDDFSTLEEYKDFYAQISSGKVFKTASLNAVETQEHFEKLLKHGKDILHICLSSGLSVTYDVVKDVANNLNATNSNKIYVLDSLSATQGQNLLATLATKFREQDMPAHEAYEKLEGVVKKMSATFYVTDFDCLKRGGRVSGVAAAIGKFAKIRPILDIDLQGKLRVVSKVMGDKKALIALAEKLDNYNSEYDTPIYIAHTGNKEAYEELEEIVKQSHPGVKVICNYIGPTIGSHTGFGALALIFYGKEERK